MYSEGRTTRSTRKRLNDHPESLIHSTRGSKHTYLSDAAILTPPPSQQSALNYDQRTTRRQWRGKRQYEDPLDQPPPTPSYPSTRKKTRYGDEVAQHNSSSSSLDPNCSSSASDPSMSTFHNEDITLEWMDLGLGLGVDGLASDNDPYLADADNKGGRDLHTPTPPMSPNDMPASIMPATPNPRPETPGNSSPLAHSMVAEMGSSSLDQDDDDDDHDATSLVAASTLSQFGPPPTPMCPPRVGNLSSSSSSSTSSLLQLSSAIRTTPSTSAAPPLNILESDDDDDGDDSVVQNNNHSKESPGSIPHDNKSNQPTPNNSINNEDNLFATSKNSPDIVSDPHIMSNGASLSPPMSPAPISTSKHSLRLRIRAPPPPSARSSQRKSDKNSNSKNRVKAGPHSIRSILKTSPDTKKHTTYSAKVGVNFLKINNNEQACSSNSTNLMLPPKPKPAANLVPSSPASKSKQDGAFPISVRTAAYPPEISKNAEYIRDGNIVQLRLINFMPHQNRTWNFEQGVTFISGENGSGKSAIQLGIKFLVGEKAANTLRTSSIKYFIKNNCSYADIEGHFTNYNGTLSQRRYGDLIKLKRHIKYTGGSTYTICGADGRWRQIKQHELGVITHSLNIDPNNPFQFLQQDRFKDSSKPGSSQQSNRDFIKFKAATQLTAIEDMLKTSLENLEVAMSLVSDKEEMKRFFALQLKQLKEQLDQILKMEMSENRLQELEVELAWSEVKIREDEQTEIQEKKAKLCPAMTVLDEEKKKLEDDISNFSNMEEKNKKLLQDVKRQIKQLETERETKVQGLREVKRTQQRAKSQHDTLISRIRQFTEEIDKLERELNKETISYETENQKHRAEMEMYRGMIEEKETTLNDLRSQRDRILGEINEYKATKRREEQKIKQLETQLNETKRELTKKDNFGRHMKELQVRIEKTKWTKKPVGPLGQQILVPDAKYAPLIEHILYSALFTFVVQTKEDFTKLKDLIKEVYNDKERNKGKVRDPTVIHIPDINVNEYMKRLGHVKEAMKGFQTVLSMVTIKNPMVEIGLIEKINCERIVLFESNQAAAAVMKDSGKVPQEVIAGYTLQWFKVTPYPRYQFQPLQGMKCKTDILPMARGETTIQIKEEISRKLEVIKTCRFNLEGNNGLETMLNKNDAEIKGAIKQVNQWKNKIKHAQSCIREEPAQGQDKEVADQIKMVTEMRSEREKEIQVPLKELELAKENAAKIKEEIEKIEGQFPEVKKKLEDLEGDHNGTNRTVAKLAKELEDCKARRKRLDKELQSLGKAENDIFFDLDEKQKRASQSGPRPKVLGKPEDVQRELEHTKDFLDRHRDKLKCKRRVLSEYNNSNALVLQITNEIDLIKQLCKLFEPLIKVNTFYYEKLKKEMSTQLTQNFKTLVEAHRLTGDLIIDWENKTLVYYVCPDKTAENKAKQSYSKKDGEVIVTDKQGVFNYVQGLSGGERSKALVFFIMAMWKITDMPFHVLDEFEACLDEHSRKDIHDKIIQHARKHSESQFFIISPLELTGIPIEKEFVRVIHLKKRN